VSWPFSISNPNDNPERPYVATHRGVCDRTLSTSREFFFRPQAGREGIMAEEIMKMDDFNAVAVALSKLDTLGEVLITIGVSETDFPESELENLGHIIQDLAKGAYRIMFPKAAD